MTATTARSRRVRAAWLERLALLGPGTIFGAVFLVVPRVLVVVYAFMTRSRFGGARRPFTLDSVQRLTEPVYRDVIVTSLLLALAATAIALVIGYPLAYGISRLPRRWRTVALIAVVLPFWTNFLIRVYAWIVLLNNEGLVNKVIRSIGITEEPLALMNNRPAIVLGFVYAYLPLMVLPLYASIERIDTQIVEAATNLGAAPFTRFRTVILPLTLTGAITGSLFVFIPSLGNFIIPELLGGGKTATLGTVVRDQYLDARDWPFGAAVALLTLVLVVLIIVAQGRLARRYGGAT